MGKKHRVSKGYLGLFVGCIIFFILVTAYFWFTYPVLNGYFITIAIISLLGSICGIYCMSFDMLCGKFSVDENGIRMYGGFKSYFHPWETIKECDVAWARTANDGGTYWIYFSERHLTIEEKRRFLSKTRRDLESIAYFQYSAALVEELHPLLPPEIARQLRENVALVESSMNNFERRHHK